MKLSNCTIRRIRFLLAKLTVSVCIGIGLLGCAHVSKSAEVSTTSVASEVFNRRAAEGFVGSVLIDQGGRVVFEQSYGVTDPSTRKPVDRNTVFDIGSITKLLTRVAILRLVEDRRLSLSDTLSKFFPEVPGDKANITVGQLLNHEGGFPDHHARDREILTREQALKRIFARKLDFVPGQKKVYSNTGYTLLAAIIQQAAGESYLSYLDGLFRQIGINRTADFSDPRFDHLQVAPGYLNGEHQGSPAAWIGPTWSTMGNGEFLSTAPDLRIFLRALIGGRIIKPAEVQIMLSRAIASPLGKKLWWAGGGAGGNASLTYYPERDVIIVVLSNRMGWKEKPGGDLQLILPAEEASDEFEKRLAAQLIVAP